MGHITVTDSAGDTEDVDETDRDALLDRAESIRDGLTFIA